MFCTLLITYTSIFAYMSSCIDAGAICKRLLNHRGALQSDIQLFVKEFEVSSPRSTGKNAVKSGITQSCISLHSWYDVYDYLPQNLLLPVLGPERGHGCSDVAECDTCDWECAHFASSCHTRTWAHHGPGVNTKCVRRSATTRSRLLALSVLVYWVFQVLHVCLNVDGEWSWKHLVLLSPFNST